MSGEVGSLSWSEAAARRWPEQAAPLNPLAERFGLTGRQVEQLRTFGAILAYDSDSPTTVRDPARVRDDHLADALVALELPIVRSAATIADIGSGAGVPGIPLAIATGVRVTLIEPTAKKAAFLREALTSAGLEGEALAERAEVSARNPRYREQFDYATARAVSRAPTVAELTMPFLRIGGRALLQRGAIDERESEALLGAALMLGAEVRDETVLVGDLRVVVLVKVRHIGERFPRRNGVPEKRPLCF